MPVRQERKALLASDDKSGAVVVDYGTVPKQPVDAPPPSKPKTFDGDLEDGALRAGPPPELLSPEVLALLMHLRMGFSALGAVLVALAFNGIEYGGSFDFSLTFPQMMFILGCLCLPLGPAAWFLVHENEVEPPKFRLYMAQFWGVLQKRAVYQVAAYKFFSGVFNSFNIVSSSNIKLFWVHATPFNASIMAIVVNVLSMDPETECWPITGGCAPDGSVDNPRQVPV
ncbi:hypothetical protein PRNP1_003828 [Phytophthora ramorum]